MTAADRFIGVDQAALRVAVPAAANDHEATAWAQRGLVAAGLATVAAFVPFGALPDRRQRAALRLLEAALIPFADCPGLPAPGAPLADRRRADATPTPHRPASATSSGEAA